MIQFMSLSIEIRMDNAGIPQDIATRRKRRFLLLVMTGLLLTPALFLGFELCDSGFYATFYDQIFHRPESVSYNFMYYLSGIAGGVVSEISGGSLLALRVAGLVVCVAAAYFASEMDASDRGIFGLTAAFIVICVGIWQTPLSLYNDNMTAAMACASLALLSSALRSNRRNRSLLLIMFAGLVAGLNTWTRLPNILEFFFLILIPLSGKRGKECLEQTGMWAAGWLSGLLLGIFLAWVLGHLESLREAFADIMTSASSSSSESTHSIAALIGVQIDTWFRIIKLMVKVSATGGIAWYFSRFTDKIWLKTIIWLLPGIPCLIWLYQSDIVTSLAAITLFGCLGAIATSRVQWYRIMAWGGILMMAIMPLGSDGGIYNAGTVTFWIAAPPAFDFIRKTCGRPVSLAVCLVLVISGSVAAFRGLFYFDSTPVEKMRAEIRNPRAAGLYTSLERAERINTLLDDLKGRVNPGDTLMVFGSAPMINHLTGTVPAIGCSWPELLTPGSLEEKLRVSPAPRHILLMRFNTLGGKWGEPSEDYVVGRGKGSGRFHNEKKSGVILDFIGSRGYDKAVSSPDYILYVLPDK